MGWRDVVRGGVVVWMAFAACGGNGTSGPGVGEERGPCGLDGGCAPGLTCASQVCVRIVSDDGGGTGGGTGSGGTGSGGVIGSGGSPATGGRGGGAGGGTGSGGQGGTLSGSGGGGAGGSSGMSRPPVFLSFAANTTVLEYQQTLTVTAVLTDPDGIDDLIGGTLLDAATGAAYGTFMTSAAEGSYAATVPWSQINTVSSITIDPTGASRTLRAEFFDVAGNKATRELTIRLHCSTGAHPVAGCCNGVQDTLSGDFSCGTCGHTCRPPSGLDTPSCSSYRCVAFLTTFTTTRASCATLCSAAGYRCEDADGYSNPRDNDVPYVGYAHYNTASTAFLHTCGDVPAASGFQDMICVCAYENKPSWYSALPPP